MKFSELVQSAYKALRAQKLRSVLTILGISIGIAVVIVIMAAGRGLDQFIFSQLEIFGSDTLTVEIKVPGVKKTSNENAGGIAQGITITTLKDRDIKAIAKHPNIVTAYGWIIGQEVMAYQGQNRRGTILGQGHTMPQVEKFTLAEGRFFTKEEEESLRQVVVLGSVAKEKLFGNDEAIGKTMYIKRRPFKVIGVAEKRGSAFFMDMDDLVIIPSQTMQKRILGVDYVSAVMAKMKDGSKAKQTAEELTFLMREQHGITDPRKDDFAVNTMEEAAEILDSIVDGITFLLVALVCISLVVGGVGIMNIMYVSVSERTFEIGLRKSLGANRKVILWQFLLEAVILTVSGGVVGIILGAGLAGLVYWVAISSGFDWAYAIPIPAIILSVGFSAFIGLLFGIYPARKAAGLHPIEALRRE